MGIDDEYKPPQPSLLMSAIVFPLYDKVVTFYPRWWRPNAITLVGIAATILASALALASMPLQTAFEPPRIVLAPTPSRDDLPYAGALAQFTSPFSALTDMRVILVLIGVLNFIYCVADNTDGRHARRWKLSSYIGEYLDHGLDCVTSLLSTFILIICMGMPPSVAAAGVAVVACVTCVSHLLNHEQGIMIWGNSYASVDEAMLMFAFAPLAPILLPGLPSWRVPFLWELKLLDLMWFIFLASQVQVALSIVKRQPLVALRAPAVFLVATIALFVAFAPVHSKEFAATQGALDSSELFAWCPLQLCPVFNFLTRLSYPAIWTIAFAFTVSMLIHIPILAKCLKQPQMSPWPLAPVIIVWLVFTSSPLAAAWLSVSFHTFQVGVNIMTIQRNAVVMNR